MNKYYVSKKNTYKMIVINMIKNRQITQKTKLMIMDKHGLSKLSKGAIDMTIKDHDMVEVDFKAYDEYDGRTADQKLALRDSF